MFLKQNTAVTKKIGPFVDSSDGDTAETALTINQANVRLSKNGGVFAQKNDANACTYDEEGHYNCQLDATDTNTLGTLTLSVKVTGALRVRHDFEVIPANVYDSLFGSDKLQVDVVEGTNIDTIITHLTGIKGAGWVNENLTTIDGLVDAIKAITDQLRFTSNNVHAHTKAEDNLNFGALKKADINAEVLDVIATDTHEEPPKENPGSTVSLKDKINYIYKFLRNKIVSDGTNVKVYNDAGDTVDHQATSAEVSGVVTRGKFGIGL